MQCTRILLNSNQKNAKQMRIAKLGVKARCAHLVSMITATTEHVDVSLLF